MANQRGRIQITPTERSRLILERYRDLTGQSMASMVSELLDASTPVLMEIIDLQEKLKSKPEQMRGHLMGFVNHAKATIETQERELEGLFPPKKGRKPKARDR